MSTTQTYTDRIVPKRKRRKKTPKEVASLTVLYIIIILFTIVMAAPFFWMISTSLKPMSEVVQYPPTWFPTKIQLNNFSDALSKAPFGRYYLNSLIVTVVTTVSVCFFSSLSGFAFAKYQFAGKNIVFFMILSGMMIPLQLRMIPLYLLLNRLNWLDSYQALILPFAITAFGVFLLRQFIQDLPDELMQAARIDGCSEMRIFFQIIIPLCKPALAALTIVTFMNLWNDFLWPLIVIDSTEMRTVQLGLALFQVEHDVIQYNQLMAATLVVLLPILAIFLSAQKYFVEGFALSGLKG